MNKANPSVMVVEDEEMLLEAITKKLELSNITPLSFKSGREAIKYLQNTKDYPQGIWLDYYLNDMNGLEFMQSIQANEKFSRIPVIVVSNSVSPQKVSAMLSLGAKRYLLKAEHRLEDIISFFREYIDNKVNI